jgi:5-methylcytosine-specific restriction endonuclease McrA
VAAEVHHRKKVVDYPELRLEWDNLAALCTKCHQAITAKERRGEPDEFIG